MNFADDCDDYDNNENSAAANDDDFDGLLVTRLPVSNFDDYDPNTTPNCGEDYLRRVQIEAQKCAEIVVSDIDVTKFKTNQTVIIEESNNFIKAKPELMASIEWQRKQVADFTRIRLKFSQMKAYLENMNDKTTTKRYHRSNTESFWKEYCLGNSGADDDDDSSTDGSMSESDLSTVADTTQCGSDSSTNAKSVRRKGNLPLLSTICDIPQHQILQLINYHIKWIRQLGFKDENALWIYALLAALDKPLPSEVYSMLRQLSRVCSEIRAKITSTTDSVILTPLNLIICLIGRYFDQIDMIDE